MKISFGKRKGIHFGKRKGSFVEFLPNTEIILMSTCKAYSASYLHWQLNHK